MHNLIVFDLDGTLAPIGKGMLEEDCRKLRELEASGYRIAICSGKPTFYLCGFLRQIGLKNPILVGENGSAIQYGVELPPKRFYTCPHSKRAVEQLRRMKERIEKACGDRVWFQPNEVELTPFPQDAQSFERIQELIDTHPDELDELLVYRQVDCFDFIPKNINKAAGLTYLAELEGLSRTDFIAVGDGINDVPMFEFADVSIGIGANLKYKTTHAFEKIGDALDYLQKECEEQ